MPPGLPCRPSSRAASGWSSRCGGYAVAEWLAAALSVLIALAACGVILGLLALAHRADEWILSEIRNQDTDRT